jgi:hypothetical protein
MSQPDYVVCEYPLPDPEMQGKWLDCLGIGGCVGEIFTISREGRVASGFEDNLLPLNDFNLTGEVLLWFSKNNQLFFYLARFINGQLQSIKKPDLIEFESRADNPAIYSSIHYCEDLGFNNGTLFQISVGGRLLKINDSRSEDTNFHGDLHFAPAMSYENNHVARFNYGQLQSIEEIEKSV